MMRADKMQKPLNPSERVEWVWDRIPDEQKKALLIRFNISGNFTDPIPVLTHAQKEMVLRNAGLLGQPIVTK